MSFTIPTSRLSSQILPFPDIAAVLSDRPFLVHVGIGDLVQAAALTEAGVKNWIPTNWPVLAACTAEQVFQFSTEQKKIQIDGGNGARIWLSYDEMIDMAESLGIHMIALPVELSATTVKRKLARQAACRTAAELASTKSSRVVDNGQFGESKLISCFHKPDQSYADWFSSITSAVLPGVIIQTDFPFRLAREGLLLTELLEIEDIKGSAMFDNMNPLAHDGGMFPEIVANAASHSKSYVHHLFRCDELSGPVLLAIVNLFRFDQHISKLATY